MKHNLTFLTTLLATTILAGNALAEDTYQNCYGAPNCMTAREYLLPEVERWNEEYRRYYGPEDDTNNYIGYTDDGYYTGEEGTDVFISVTDNGELTIYGPKENGEKIVPILPGYGNGADWRQFFYTSYGPTSLKLEGNVELHEPIAGIKTLSISNGASVSPEALEYSDLKDIFIGDDVVFDVTIRNNDTIPYYMFDFEKGDWDGSWDTELETYGQFLESAKQWFLDNPLSEGIDPWDMEGGYPVQFVYPAIDLSKVTIHCSGDLSKCKSNMAEAGYPEGTYTMIQAPSGSGDDASALVKKYNGTPLLYGKKIYTMKEAQEALSDGTKFHVGLTYK